MLSENERESGPAKKGKREAGTSDTDFRELSENAIVIRSRALQGFVDNIKTRQESLEELAALGIDLEAACYRVAVFDLDLYSDAVSLLRRNARRVH